MHHFAETDSTNIQAKKLVHAPHGALVVADAQNAGRGRLGRSWQSPAGSNIYMSILLKPDLEPDRAPMLTLVMALSVAEAVKQLSGLDGKIKWPNDIVLNKKKICGILTEMDLEAGKIKQVVIGVGVNVNMQEFPEEIAATATSLKVEAGCTFNREALIALIMERFEEHYETFVKKMDLSGLADKYNALLINKNKEVRVLEPGREYSGYALGVDEKGRLLVEKEDGDMERIFAGEVSVRGLYGYV